MISYDSLLKVSAIQGFILVVTIKFALTYGKLRDVIELWLKLLLRYQGKIQPTLRKGMNVSADKSF